jgi:uncharacterized protein (UPF0332 family)
LAQARERLAAAREALDNEHLSVAVSVAYYAMLNAARAALSEHDESTRTHRGAWNAFRIRYVTTDAFDAGLFTMAQHAQAAREGADYAAVTPTREEASRYVVGAGDFITAVEQMLAA